MLFSLISFFGGFLASSLIDTSLGESRIACVQDTGESLLAGVPDAGESWLY